MYEFLKNSAFSLSSLAITVPVLILFASSVARHGPLIADILGDEKPEIICKNNGLISILDNEGSIIIDIPNYGYDKELSLVSNWGNANSVALINGNRLMVLI